MNFLSYFFGDNHFQIKGPKIDFGRFSDAQKSTSQYKSWDLAIQQFKKKELKNSFLSFLDYLSLDSKNNVNYQFKETKLHFTIFQGSKQVNGVVDENKILAWVTLAKADEFPIQLIRELCEKNYTLQFCRYALSPDNELKLITDSFLYDASPYKMYYSLKELATSADKLDDIMYFRFPEIQPLFNDIKIQLPNKEVNCKIDFLNRTINGAIEYCRDHPYLLQHNPGAISYILLSVAYKIDYLTKPEGQVNDYLEQIHAIFFSKEEKSLNIKNRKILEIFAQITKLDTAQLKMEFYNIVSTFGLHPPANSNKIKHLIHSELTNMQWYVENEMEDIVWGITEYICGYSLFNFSVPPPVKDLFHVLFQIRNHQYFLDLGYEVPELNSEGIWNKRTLQSFLRNVKETHLNEFPNFNPHIGDVDMSNKMVFCESYLRMVANLDLMRENEPYALTD